MSHNYTKDRKYRGVIPAKIAEGDQVVFGGKLSHKHNGGLRKASREETLEFIRINTQRKEQQQ